MTELILSEGKAITLNEDQEHALEEMDMWWQTTERYFLLVGAAGTGKSTITKHFLNQLPKKLHYDNDHKGNQLWRPLSICVAAPTHQAKDVIEELSGYPGHTLQRLLGLSPDISVDNFDPEKPEFKQKRTPLIADYDLIILDESSMINKPLFEYIGKSLKTHAKAGYHTKIMFMGDVFQLAPVGETESVVFTTDLITSGAVLTKVERQADGNPLLGVYTAIRQDITSKYGAYKREDLVNEFTGEGLQFLPARPFGQKMIELFTSEEYQRDPFYAKVLCWTNKMVAYWNNGLRTKIMEGLHPGKPLTKIMVGEVLKAYSGYEGKTKNSTDYVVTRVEASAYDCPYPTPQGQTHVVKLRTWAVWMKPVGKEGEIFTHVLNQSHESDVKDYLKAYWGYINAAKKTPSAWAQFFLFRSWVLLMDTIPTSADGKFNITKDLDYGYAQSTHKSQGSTFQNVFIDEVDINSNWNTTDRNKLMYVALSRPRKMAYVRTT